jgi:hypothetical protein
VLMWIFSFFDLITFFLRLSCPFCRPIYLTMEPISNNVERRLGVSVIVLYSLALSKVFAAYKFYQIHPLAGKCLAATLTWLTAAAALETHTWRINPDPDTGKPEPLYPAKAPKWKTRFRWESSS